MARISASDRDHLSPVWDMSQERAFMEGIFNQRFNFFLVFFSVVLAGAVNARSREQLFLVLCIGSVVAVFFSYSIFRAYRKLSTILTVLFSDESHPATIVDQAHYKWLTVRWVTGWFIPGLCTVLLMAGAAGAYTRTLPVPGPSHELQALTEQTAAVVSEVTRSRQLDAAETARLHIKFNHLREEFDAHLARCAVPERPDEALQRGAPSASEHRW